MDAAAATPTLRRRIVEAADKVIRDKGIAGATTREIARAAGCAEGSIYVHFTDKTDLVIAVVTEREPHFAEMLELPGKAGQASVEDNLAAWVEELIELFRENLPIFLAVLADRAVLAASRSGCRSGGRAPLPSPVPRPPTCGPSRSSGACGRARNRESSPRSSWAPAATTAWRAS